MENGVGGSQFGRRDGVEEEVMESRSEVMPVVLSGELRGTQGDDEVYEEAVTGDTPRIDVGVGVVGSDGNAVRIESSDMGNEVDKFEEAFEGKEDVLAREERISADEGVGDNRIVDNEDKQPIDTAGDAGNLGGDEINKKLDQDNSKADNGAVECVGSNEVVAHDAVPSVLTPQPRDQGEELMGDQNANEVKGGNGGPSVEFEFKVDENTEAREAYSVINVRHRDEKFKDRENTSSSLYSEHLDYLGKEVVDFPTESDAELKWTASSMPAENKESGNKQAVQTNIPSATDFHGLSPENIAVTHSPLEKGTEAAEEDGSLSLEDSIDKIGAGPVVLKTELSEGSEPLQEASVGESQALGKETGTKDRVDLVMQATPQSIGETCEPTTDVSPPSTRTATSAPLPPQPAGLGRGSPLFEPTSRSVQQPRVNGTVSPLQNQLVEDPANGEAEETDETREKLQMIRVKFLRLAHRLGQTPHNVVVAQVLYRLGLAEQLRGRSGGRVGSFSFDRASSMAERLETSGQQPLDFSCTIMVLGKTGVGKSATINSIFDEVKFNTDAFQSGTKKVQDVVGSVQGIKVRVIDTPGLLPSWSDQRKNEKILQSIKQHIKKTSPDIVLYLDRLDMPSREFGDMPLLRTITEIFGPSIWFNAIVVLTHAASAPPEGPNGTTSYDMFVTQRSHVVQQAIRQAAGDMRLMNPVSLVENHSACRTNRAGQRVLPNGQVWKPHLLLLSFASKILAEANTLLKLQDSPPGKPFAPRSRAPTLPFLLSSLLQSRPPVKLPVEQFGGDDDTLDDDLDESSDSEDELEFEKLPPFKRLNKSQLASLPRAQRKAYDDELEYREKLFMKKLLREEKERRRMLKKMQAEYKDLPNEYQQNVEEESGVPASVPVPVPDLALPASFDSDNPTHRYRCLDSSNQWLVRPVLDPNSWDHDVGYEGINAEKLFAVGEKIPVSFSGQISKDKKDTNLQMEIASTVKHGEGKATSFGFDLQSMGRDIAYTLRSETRFSNWRKNKALAGLSVTLLGASLSGGLKVEDKLIVNRQGQVVVSAGAVVGRGDVAYGGSLEATLRDKDHPLGCFLSTLGLSVMDCHGDLAIGGNLQSQIPIGRSSNLIGRVSINNRGSGQVSIRFNSTEHLQIILIGTVPLFRKLLSQFQPVQLG